jgi:general secretion pathway protein K
MACESPGQADRQRADDGFIVVAVLWILLALAALVSVFAIYVANTELAVSVNDDSVQAEALVSASLELTAYKLVTIRREDRPTHGAFSYRLGRANVDVDFRSEAARIDLNKAPKELLAGLFTALGASYDNAQDYADRVIGWRTAPSTDTADKEVSLYRAAGLNYGPRGGPFGDAAELALVLGLPPALVEAAMPYVTIYSGREEVNILDAAPIVLAAVPGMTPARLSTFLGERGGLDGQSATTQLGDMQNAVTTEGSKAMRVTVGVRFDSGRRIVSQAVILVGGREKPYRVLSWQDDIDMQGATSPLAPAFARGS